MPTKMAGKSSHSVLHVSGVKLFVKIEDSVNTLIATVISQSYCRNHYRRDNRNCLDGRSYGSILDCSHM